MAKTSKLDQLMEHCSFTQDIHEILLRFLTSTCFQALDLEERQRVCKNIQKLLLRF